MIYTNELTIPAQTDIDSPVTADIHVVNGTVKHIHTFFPFGHAGLTHVRYLVSNTQIHPVTPGGYLIGDNILLSLFVGIAVDKDVPIIKIEAYNDDTLFSHTIYSSIEIAHDPISLSVLEALQGVVFSG